MRGSQDLQGLRCNRIECLHPSGLISLAPGMAYHALDLNICTLMEISLRSGRSQGKYGKWHPKKKKRFGHPEQFTHHFDFVLIWL